MMRADAQTLVWVFQGTVVVGLLGGLLVSSFGVVLLTVAAALTVFVADGYMRPGPRPVPPPAAEKAAPPAGTPVVKEAAPAHAPAQLIAHAPAPTEGIRVPLYSEKDWDFVKPWWQMSATQQFMYRPTAERTVEPLGARKAFVKFWAQDADAFAVKDRFCIRKGGTQVIQQRF